jgi:lycopene cyclase domain-containing protein
MKWLYAAFDLAVAAGPLLATRIWLRDFWQHWRALAISIATIGVPWVVMDIAAHHLGWWYYNTAYVFGLRVFGLPIEEILFFVVVPFACLVVWHVYDRQKGTVPQWLPRIALAALVLVCIGLIAFHFGRLRTVVDAAITIVAVAALWDSELIRRRAWWYWSLTVLALFLVCNTFLTAVPIVEYNMQAATGWRIGTIPFEDFLYNFSLLNLLLLAYSRYKK